MILWKSICHSYDLFVFRAAKWLKCWRYGVEPYSINQSINLSLATLTACSSVVKCKTLFDRNIPERDVKTIDRKPKVKWKLYFFYVNLRYTTVSNWVDEQEIMSRTGHRSETVVRKYKRSNSVLMENVSKVLNPPKDDEIRRPTPSSDHSRKFVDEWQ